MQQIINRVEVILAKYQHLNKFCETCREPQYAVAGSEDVNGMFAEWLCMNDHCPRYLESVKE